MDKRLPELKQKLEGDRDRYFALYNQALGALQAVEHLMKPDDALSVEEAEEMIGAKFENIEEIDGANHTAAC